MGRSPGKRSGRRTALVALLLGIFSNTPWHALARDTGEATLPVYIATAANFYLPLKELVAHYREQRKDVGDGINILISSGSSGSLFRQIKHGSPHQIFLSADSFYPEQLENEQLILPGTRTTYAVGELLLWHPGTSLDSLQQLKQHNLTLAIANPKTAPYGRAAQQVLNKLEPAMPWRLVIGASIAQTYQFIDSGNAPAGIVSRSQVLGITERIKPIPSEWYPPLVQQMVLTRKAENHPHARELFEYLSSEAARRIIQASGYRVPETRSYTAQTSPMVNLQ